MRNWFINGLLALSLVLGFSQAQAEPRFEEDLHYFSVIPAMPGAEGGRVTVMEFFWYGCPHCYTLEPAIDEWLKRKPDYVDFVPVPAMFNSANVILHAKTYYALKLMGEAERLRPVIFDAMHRQKLRLDSREEMEQFLGKQGVDVEAFRKALASFAVQTQAKRAATLARRFDVRGVPAIVVDGKYRAGGLEGETLMQLTDYLVEKVRKEKQAVQ